MPEFSEGFEFTISEPGALCAERFRTRILVCSSRAAMATQRHSGNFAHMRLHDENDSGAKPGNSGVLGQSGAFLFLGVLGILLLSLRLAPSVSVAATCENAVAAERRPTGVLSFECCMAATLRYTAATLYHRFSYVSPLSFPVLSVTVLLLFQVLSKISGALLYFTKLYYFRKKQYLFYYCHRFA